MTSARPALPPATASLPCRLDVPAWFEEPARYALEELLRPLGLEPAWDASGGSGLWYGRDGQEAPPGWMRLGLRPPTLALLESDRPLRPEAVRWTEAAGSRLPVLFEGDLDGAVDPVATAFFWLAGIQEERIRARDVHGRFSGASSLQHALGLGEAAPVDAVRDRLAAMLRAAGIPLFPRRWGGRPWALCPTHDVDYVRKWRPGILWRESVEYLLLNRRRVPVTERARRFGAGVADAVTPGDPYRRAMQRMADEVEGVGGTATWFFKAGAHGPHDVGYRLESARTRAFVRGLQARGHEVGLHPSYHASTHPAYLASEAGRLRRVAGRGPTAVRTHYLRWDSAVTPGLLAAIGASVDSSMGFADRPGFRHGTTMPFRLWDARRGQPHPIWEMPLGLMESVLFNRCGLDPAAAAARTRALAATAAAHGGCLVGLWHTTLWDEEDFPAWGDHFVTTLRSAREDGATVASLSDALAGWAPAPE